MNTNQTKTKKPSSPKISIKDLKPTKEVKGGLPAVQRGHFTK